MYYLTISNFNFSKINTVKKITLLNIQKHMQTYDFEDTLELKCIDDGKKCLVYIDNTLSEEINGIFDEKPIVYEYNRDLNIIYYEDIELKELERYEVCFKYTINKYKKSKDLIVEYKQKVYILNSLDLNVSILEYASDVSEYFDKKEQEVRDAF